MAESFSLFKTSPYLGGVLAQFWLLGTGGQGHGLAGGAVLLLLEVPAAHHAVALEPTPRAFLVEHGERDGGRSVSMLSSRVVYT